MSNSLILFKGNISAACDLIGLEHALSALATSALDTSDLLRASMVFSVSALDHYVHEKIVEMAVEIAIGARGANYRFSNSRIGKNAVMLTASGSPVDAMVESEVRGENAFSSFQQPEKITSAFKRVSNVNIWRQVGLHLAMNEAVVMRNLKLVVSRRNQIAHEADRNPAFPYNRWPINSSDASFASDLIDAIITAFDAAL